MRLSEEQQKLVEENHMKTQLGATSEQIGSLLQSIMDFAKTTGMANTDVVGAVDDIGDAWGLTAEESVGYLDILKQSSEEYGTDIASVRRALSQVAPASKALGLSLDETNGIMNMFAASGLDSSQAIMALTYAAKTVKSPEEFRIMLADKLVGKVLHRPLGRVKLILRGELVEEIIRLQRLSDRTGIVGDIRNN